MLKLRRGTVTGDDPLTIRVDGAERRAWADEGMVGQVRLGDEVIVNVEARDLGLGSGGFDVVHVNLTRGLDGGGDSGARVMKLNYTSLQHAVKPVEAGDAGVEVDEAPQVRRRIPVLVLLLHGQLAPAAWATARATTGLRVGYVQTPGGALPGSLSHDVAELRSRDLLCGHLTAAAAHGGQGEAISVVGALHAAAESLGWDAVIAGPGPGMLGSESRFGHGGIEAMNAAHAALALGLETVIAPRLSSGDPRARHHGLSHHTETVLGLLLGEVRVAAPDLEDDEWPGLERLRSACDGRHELTFRPAELDDYAASGLPAETMGRRLDDDRLFFAAALAAGAELAAAVRVGASA